MQIREPFLNLSEDDTAGSEPDVFDLWEDGEMKKRGEILLDSLLCTAPKEEPEEELKRQTARHTGMGVTV